MTGRHFKKYILISALTWAGIAKKLHFKTKILLLA